MPPKNPRCKDCPPSKHPRPAPYPGPRCASHHKAAGGELPRQCKDCPPTSKRPAPHKGPRCTTHHREATKRRRDAAHERRVGDTYGLAPGDYDKLYRLQGGRCAICTRGKGISRRLAVDHDHKCCAGTTSCGTCVRGLVCGRCNSMLGHARDELDFFIRAHRYLFSPPARRLKGSET
ncbi:endonuclease VII domain-containing protein [Streptomyces atriruber]|uniref:endonuclease VII domain-containing protein n=1 Tax=Streptomyces atriruber TaxID=545121 RepID=UPI00099EC7E2|nr:endonuclease VII domain-containing protein [Streptomyces atriruber]